MGEDEYGALGISREIHPLLISGIRQQPVCMHVLSNITVCPILYMCVSKLRGFAFRAYAYD